MDDNAHQEQPWIPNRLLVPWSSRLSCAGEVCGLPGKRRGCWRHEQASTSVALRELREDSLKPAFEGNQPERWVVLRRRSAPDGSASGQAEIAKDVTDDAFRVDALLHSEGYHHVLLGFDQGPEGWQPVSLECKAWVEGGHRDIEQWAPGPGSSQQGPAVPSLYECFGPEIFIPQDLGELSRGRQHSIADLIAWYLNAQCQSFRKDPRFGEHLGVSLCHLEVHLETLRSRERTQTGEGCRRTPPEAGFSLTDYAWSFSQVNPLTREMDFLEELSFPRLHLPEAERQLREHLQHARPLPIHVGETSDLGGEVTYADCFTPAGRSHILPGELDRSYLTFSAAEITAYLLDWLLSRCVAGQEAVHGDFRKALDAFLASPVEAGGEPLRQLLATRVTLEPDEALFQAGLVEADPAAQLGRLGASFKPVAFHQFLETVGLERGGELLRRVADFLRREFPPAGCDAGRREPQGFRLLPMFRELGWEAVPELCGDAWEAQEQEGWALEPTGGPGLPALGWVVRSLARALAESPPADARERASRLVRRSVFPLAHVLTHRPPGWETATCYIFPIWESAIFGHSRPSIFAHVFSRRDTSADRDPAAEGRFLQSQLLSFGRLLGQSSYEQRLYSIQLQHEIASAAYSIGHPMRRRVDSVHTVLRDLRFDLRSLSGSEDRVRDVDYASRLLKRVSNIGYILDALAVGLVQPERSEAAEKTALFVSKADWHACSPANLGELLAQAEGAPTQPGAARTRVVWQGEGSPRDHGISPWIEDPKGDRCRPADAFYEEIFYELLLNAGRHGRPENGFVPVEIGFGRIPLPGLDRGVLLVRNQCILTPEPASVHNSTSPWQPSEVNARSSVGGLFFLASLFRQTAIGRMWYRFERDPTAAGDGAHFVMALDLEGLGRMDPHAD